ncbi:hypothetical protein ABBQ32_008711 [Trebouxia sp. C0010 RCD-2024]
MNSKAPSVSSGIEIGPVGCIIKAQHLQLTPSTKDTGKLQGGRGCTAVRVETLGFPHNEFWGSVLSASLSASICEGLSQNGVVINIRSQVNTCLENSQTTATSDKWSW